MTNIIQRDALLARFSVLAYRDRDFLGNRSNLPAGWKLVDQDDLSPPFAAFAFQNEATGQVVIAYRGTDGLTDLPADLNLLTGSWNPQFDSALRFANSVLSNSRIVDPLAPPTVLTTGHSLGGAMAQLVAQAFGVTGMGLDPAGAARLLQTDGFRSRMQEFGLAAEGVGMPASFSNQLAAGSLVSSGTGPHIGSTSYVAGLSFSGEQALRGFLIGLLNPVLGFAYVVGIDQAGNKHASDVLSQSPIASTTCTTPSKATMHSAKSAPRCPASTTSTPPSTPSTAHLRSALQRPASTAS